MIEMFKNQSFLYLLVINVIAALGMNLVYMTGQLNLGQAGFLALGAYTTAVTDKALGWPFGASLLAGALVAALVALPVALGANRVRGIYLIMGTLAVGEVVRVAIGNIEAIGGLQGYSGIQPASPGQVAATVLLVLAATTVLMSSPLGLQMRSIFDDEDAAAAAGVATRRVKVASVSLSAAVVAVAGGLMAKWLLFIAPRNFGIDLSFRVALFTLIGGVHSPLGAVAGAFSVTYLLEALKRIGEMHSLPSGLANQVGALVGSWRLVIYGALVMLLMAVRPEGLVTREISLALARPLHKAWRNVRRNVRRRLRGGQLRPPGRRDRSAAPGGPVRRSSPAGCANLVGEPGKLRQPGGRVLLEMAGICHDFGGLRALQNVSLTVYEDEILALIGANGAGKTTLTNVIAGLYPLQAGSLRLRGVELAGLRPERRTRAGIARTFQTVRMFAHLTVAEQLQLGRQARRQRSWRDRPAPSIGELLELLGLEGRGANSFGGDALPAALSLAERRKLEIGRALACMPYVLILDEPSAGMNPAERADLAALIRQIRERGTTVVLIDHNLDLAFSVAERVAVMDFGELLCVGTPEQVLNDPQVQAAYLGKMEGTD